MDDSLQTAADGTAQAAAAGAAAAAASAAVEAASEAPVPALAPAAATTAGAPLQANAPEGATLSMDVHAVEWNGQVSTNLFHLFVNETGEPLDLSWGDEHGTDNHHSTVKPRDNAYVGTYAFHTWRVRSQSRGLITSYKGPSATVFIQADGCKTEMNTNGPMPQLPYQQQPHNRHSQPTNTAAASSSAPAAGKTVNSTANGDGSGVSANHHPQSGHASGGPNGGAAAASPAVQPGYRQRSSVLGMPIWAFNAVSDAAVARLGAIVGSMLIHVPRPLLVRLVAGGGSFAIFGSEQVVSDVPAHRFMRHTSGRNLDTSARGLGATPTVPVTSCGEENLTMEGDRCACGTPASPSWSTRWLTWFTTWGCRGRGRTG